MIPLSKPNTGTAEQEAVKAVLKSGWLAHGKKNEEFEKKFAQYIGTKYACTFNSCTSALISALKALGIKGEVILPSFTFVASANAVEIVGASCVFADIDINNFNIDPRSIEEKITSRTEAIMPVHVAGRACDMGAITKIARKYRLALIEDSAEAIGSEFKNKKTGSFGIGCFSFFPTKNMTVGEGGMITTNNEKIYKLAKALGAHGIFKDTYARQKSKKPWLRISSFPGYNFRMSNILAAIGVEQLKILEAMNERRIAHARYLNQNLTAFGIDVPKEENFYKHVYQMYLISVKPRIRDDLFRYLIKNDIGATIFSDPPVHLQPYFQKKYRLKIGSLPQTELAAKSNIVLPMFPQMSRGDLDQIIKVIKNYGKK